MIKILGCALLVLLASSLYANEVLIDNIKIRPALLPGYPTSIYFTLENNKEIDYLVGIELIDYPNIKLKLQKSILEKGVTRVITIDKLALPSHIKIDTFPLHIYAVTNELPTKIESLRLKFIFVKQDSLMHSGNIQ